MNFSIRSHHYHVSLLTLLAVAIGLVWWFARSDGPNIPLESWLSSGRQEVQTAAKYRWDVRVLSGQVAAHLHHEARLAQDTAQLRRSLHQTQGAIENLVHSVDSLHRAPLTVAVRRVGEACGEALNNCAQRAEAWRQQDSLHLAMYQLAAPRLAKADSIIAQGLRATQCKFLLVFGCLSRTRAAELGLVVGVVTTLVVRR